MVACVRVRINQGLRPDAMGPESAVLREVAPDDACGIVRGHIQLAWRKLG